MTALLLALLLGLLLEQGSSTQHSLAGHPNRPTLLVTVLLLGTGAAALAGGLVGAVLDGAAARLFFALTLFIAALGLIAQKLVAMMTGRSDTPRTGFWPVLAERLSGNGSFVLAGVAAWSDRPVLAGVGGALGTLAGLLPATLPAYRSRTGRRLIRVVEVVTALILLTAGIGLAASAFQLP